ncbi:MAG: pseudouridine synthase [Pseudoflavonifractor sp.]
MEERLQKLLSSCGVTSRRGAETYIEAGRVKVNGAVAHLGDKADLTCDKVEVDGKPLCPVAAHTYLMLHKPRGFVTTLSDERGRKTVAELVADCGARVWPVGRLDLDSEGLLLMTDDGDLTQRLIHPSHEVEKEYLVSVLGDLAAAVPILSGPMELDGEPLSPAKVRPVPGGKLSVIIHEGKNRQVRRMCEAANLKVTRLRRVREGSLVLGELPTGKWRRLTPAEVEQIRTLSSDAPCRK